MYIWFKNCYPDSAVTYPAAQFKWINPRVDHVVVSRNIGRTADVLSSTVIPYCLKTGIFWVADAKSASTVTLHLQHLATYMRTVPSFNVHRPDDRYIVYLDKQPVFIMIFTCVSIHLIDQCNVFSVNSIILVQHLHWSTLDYLDTFCILYTTSAAIYYDRKLACCQMLAWPGVAIESIDRRGQGGCVSIPTNFEVRLLRQSFKAHKVELPLIYRLSQWTTGMQNDLRALLCSYDR